MTKPEEKARQKIDEILELAGWTIQDYENFDVSTSMGVIVREFQLSTGPADYLMFLNGKVVGVIEAKPKGTSLIGVDPQSKRYLEGIDERIAYTTPVPFAYESTGSETLFRDVRDPDFRSRRIFAFHTPKTLLRWISQEKTLRTNLREMPNLIEDGLRICQIDAVENLEVSLAQNRPRALIQMATGSGKTFAAINSAYRLIKYGGAERILFLVDRKTLGKQAFNEFQQFKTPDDGRKFTELYNVQHLTSNTIDPVNKVCITTIQRLYSMLKGEKELDTEIENSSLFDINPAESKPLDISYNPQIPIETFDFIITDECHRSIYNVWRQVIEYFDAYIIGLTATPSKQTMGFFKQNLVTEYNNERAEADGVSVGYDIYRIKTKISEQGSKVNAGFYVDIRDRKTREKRLELLDDDYEYHSKQLDRSVVAQDQIITVIKTFKDNLKNIFPGRTNVPKTLVFAKNDSHADDIVEAIREEFGKGNEFCQKITYRTTGVKTEDLIKEFRNSYNPRIVVTVDMISTGTNIKPLECLIFMRDVKSSLYFDQMKGRGTRTISPTDLKAVTPDANYKDHYVIVDAVGVCETDKTESRSLERKRNVSLDKILKSVALGIQDKDTISTLSARLTRLDRKIKEKDRKEIKDLANKPLNNIINELLDSIDPDKHIEKACEIYKTDDPTKEQIKKAAEEIAKKACKPFYNPKLRNTIVEVNSRSEQLIDSISKDELISIEQAKRSFETDKNAIKSFKQFIDDNKDEITALHIILDKPYGELHITFDQIHELADAIKKPPYNLDTKKIWKAYETLEKSKVRGAKAERKLTDIISLIRFTVGESNSLKPFEDTVNENFNKWIQDQGQNGRKFTEEEKEWLYMIKDHIATSLSIGIDDFENVPFHNKGGAMKIYNIFGDDLYHIIEELNEVLIG